MSAGPWAEDARRILEILQGHDGRHEGFDADASAECRHCPVCQGMAVVRRSGPEVLDRVADLAAGLAATLRATAPAPGPSPDAASGASPAAPPAAGRDGPVPPSSTAARPPVTVPIDISD